MSRVPSYGGQPYPPLPGYCLERDPLWRPDREYGPGHPFCSPAHEAYEAARMAREKVERWIEHAAREARDVALSVGYDDRI